MFKAKLRARASMAVFGAMLAILPCNAQAQGLFDAIVGIFTGGPKAPPPSNRDYEADNQRRRAAADRAAEARRHRAALESHGGVSGKMQALAPADGVTYGSVQHFAADPTLRSGDVLVTPSGFVVYRGGSFSPVKDATGNLAALERASVKAPETAWATSTPVAADPGVVQRSPIERVSVKAPTTPDDKPILE